MFDFFTGKFLIFSITLVLISILTWRNHIIVFDDGPISNLRRNLIEWGKSFGGVVSSNVIRNCTFNSHPICCSISTPFFSSQTSNNSHYRIDLADSSLKDMRCKIHRQYFPSDYERRHLEMSKKLDQIAGASERRNAFVEFITSPVEVNASERWISRVKVHMESESVPSDSDDDNIFLSKFIVTQECAHPSMEHSARSQW